MIHNMKSEQEQCGICVISRPGEDPEILAKRFKKKFLKSGVMQEYKERLFFEKPSDKKRRKKRESVRRARIELAKAGR